MSKSLSVDEQVANRLADYSFARGQKMSKQRLLLAGLLLLVSYLPAQADKPNIVLIMVDDLGFSDLGCYGSEIQTPVIDKLASDGLRFTQCYNTAKCHSSRVCLLSGQWCHDADKPGKNGSGLRNAATIAQVLKPAGYFTAMAGKWHLNGNPVNFGFDRYWGHLSGSTSFFEPNSSFRLDDKTWKTKDPDFYTTDANTDFALQFIDQRIKTKKPFFLYIAFNAPHYPLHVRKDDYKKYQGKYDIGWDKIRQARFAKQKELGIFSNEAKLPARPNVISAWDKLSPEKQQWESRRMTAYAGMIDRVDQQLGRLTQHLKDKGVFDNTLILLVSDNGACPFDRTKKGTDKLEPWNPKSYWCYSKSWAWACNTPLKYYKQNQHEGGISTPMIAHWPAGLKAKGWNRQPCHLVDVLPTLMDVGQATYPKQQNNHEVGKLAGLSLVPAFVGKKMPDDREFFFHFSNNRALRQGDWKLVSCTGGAWELYNLADDRFEQHNLANKFPQRVQAMAKRYQELWHDSVKVSKTPGVPSTHGQKKKKSST